MAYLIEVLLGKTSERITSFGHDKQSTFGIGKELDEQQWYSVFRQLVARGLVAVNFEHFGALQLTEACRPILRGEQQLILRKDISRKKSNPVKKPPAAKQLARSIPRYGTPYAPSAAKLPMRRMSRPTLFFMTPP